ncbi:uncharacterized protein SPAPADRAFT_143869, partial [Spathaspora passalidarum NRRL Y-27907]
TPEHPTRNIREYPRTSYPQHKRVPSYGGVPTSCMGVSTDVSYASSSRLQYRIADASRSRL